MTRDFAACPGVIVDAPEIIAIWHGSECAVKRKDLHAVPWQVELANDFGTKKRNNVRGHRELETWKNLFRDRGTAQNVAAFEYNDLFSGSSKIGCVHEPVVSGADYDDVIPLHIIRLRGDYAGRNCFS
jgi:hypothetical protein